MLGVIFYFCQWIYDFMSLRTSIDHTQTRIGSHQNGCVQLLCLNSILIRRDSVRSATSGISGLCALIQYPRLCINLLNEDKMEIYPKRVMTVWCTLHMERHGVRHWVEQWRIFVQNLEHKNMLEVDLTQDPRINLYRYLEFVEIMCWIQLI